MAVNPDTTTRKLVSLPHAMVRAIEDFRFEQRIKTESEAIRRLIERGLGTPPAPQGQEAVASAPNAPAVTLPHLLAEIARQNTHEDGYTPTSDDAAETENRALRDAATEVARLWGQYVSHNDGPAADALKKLLGGAEYGSAAVQWFFDRKPRGKHKPNPPELPQS